MSEQQPEPQSQPELHHESLAEPLPRPVSEAIEGINAENEERFLAAFDADAVVDDWGRTFTGPEEIAGWNRSDNVDKHTRIRVTDHRVEENPAGAVVHAVSIDVTGQGFNGAGTMTFRLTEDAEAVERLDVT
jgi:hypothetical protein